MKYSYHPEIEGLKVNEDGTEILLDGLPLVIKKRTTGKHPFLYVNLRSSNQSVVRLVMECWHGMAPYPKMAVRRKDNDNNNCHYTNLEWGAWGGNPKNPTKLSVQDENEIWELLQNSNMSKTDIGAKYGVHRNAINCVAKRMKQRLNLD